MYVALSWYAPTAAFSADVFRRMLSAGAGMLGDAPRSAYNGCARDACLLPTSPPWYTSAYVSISQHMSAYVVRTTAMHVMPVSTLDVLPGPKPLPLLTNRTGTGSLVEAEVEAEL